MTSSRDDLKWKVGVVGATGFIGTPYRREIREATEEATIVALCARRRELLEAAGLEDGAELITGDWRAVVEHPAVNLMVVATPDALHLEQVMAAAGAGKHMLCEKPVGINAGEARRMWVAYRESGLGHFVPFWTRYIPVFARAREVYQSGTLGEIKAVIYRWHNPRPAAIPFTWRDDAQLSAAGSIADVGSHAYDTMRWILGQEAVRALAHADVITPAKPDLGAINLGEAIQWGQSHQTGDTANVRKGTAFDYATVSFEWQSGAVGTLILSHAPYLRKGLAPELELHGELASLAVDRIRSTLMLAHPDQEPRLLEKVADPGFGNRFSKHVFPAMRAHPAGVHTEHPSLEDGWRVQLFTDAAAFSAKGGGWVELGPSHTSPRAPWSRKSSQSGQVMGRSFPCLCPCLFPPAVSRLTGLVKSLDATKGSGGQRQRHGQGKEENSIHTNAGGGMRSLATTSPAYPPRPAVPTCRNRWRLAP